MLFDDLEADVRYLDMYFIIHYPGQFFLFKPNEARRFSMIQLGSTNIRFQELEILKRRNSRDRKCLNKLHEYDKAIIDEFLIKKACRPPYLAGHKMYHKCNSLNKIKRVE